MGKNVDLYFGIIILLKKKASADQILNKQANLGLWSLKMCPIMP